MVLNPLQPENADPPIEVKPSGKEISPSKAADAYFNSDLSGLYINPFSTMSPSAYLI